MAEDATEAHVPFDDLQVGRADAGPADATKGIAIGLREVGLTGAEGMGLVEGEGAHR